MRKSLKLGIISMAMFLCVGGGFLASHAQKEQPTKSNAAVNGVILATGNDSTCSDTKYYSQSGSDKTSLSYTSDLKSTNTAHYTFGQSEARYSATEDSANKLYNYVYRPFFIYPQESGYVGIPKASRYTITITFSLTLTKSASGGTARAFAELFFLGNGNGKPEPVLANGTFNTNDSQSSNSSTNYNNASNSDSSIGVYTNQPSSAITTTKQLTITFDNESPTNNNVVRYQLGLFVGCNYASGKDHTTSAVVEMSFNTVIKSDLIAQVGSNYYYEFSTALSAYNGAANQTLRLLRNVNVNAATEAYRNINMSGTINLGGFTLTSNNMFVLSIRNSATVTIQNGTIAHTGNQYAISIASGSTVTISNDVTITSSGSGCINNSGTLTIQGTANANTGTALTNGGTATLSNATLTTGGDTAHCVVNEGTLNISSSTLNASTNGKSLLIRSSSAITRIYGSSSLPRGISVASGYRLQKLYLYSGTTRYTGSTISMTYQDYTLVDGDIPFYAYVSSDASKISITNTLSTWLNYSYNTSSKAYTVKYNLYTITVNMTHGTYTLSKSSNVTYADTVTLTLNVDEGYRVTNTCINAAGCNCSLTDNVVTVSSVRSNATITITPTIIRCTLYYDGNGHTSVNYSGSEYGSGNGGVHDYGTTITVLKNGYGKTNYSFAGWNTKADGTGDSYFPGDTFVIRETTTLYAQWVESEYSIVDEFVTTYMHMSDYTGNGDGSCISHAGGDGYYIIAKRALADLTESQVNLFRNDARYVTPRTRYERWAQMNGDTQPYVGNTIVRSNLIMPLSSGVNENTVTIIITTVLSLSALSAVLLFVFKRKHN